jgi:biopolymer transport protein ExbD
MKNPKNIALGIIALSLIILAGIAIYDKWSGYIRAKEAEAALAEAERNRPARIQVDVPARSKDSATSPSTLLVSVDSQGALRVNGEPAGTLDDTSQMRAKLGQAINDRSDKSVTVKASSRLKYPAITKLMNEIREIGAGPVGLQVDEVAAN